MTFKLGPYTISSYDPNMVYMDHKSLQGSCSPEDIQDRNTRGPQPDCALWSRFWSNLVGRYTPVRCRCPRRNLCPIPEDPSTRLAQAILTISSLETHSPQYVGTWTLGACNVCAEHVEVLNPSFLALMYATATPSQGSHCFLRGRRRN